MADSTTDKAQLIEEIQRRIANLVSTDLIPDQVKITIARRVLNLIENGKKEKGPD